MKAFKCDRCGRFYFSGPEPIAQNAMDVVDAHGDEKHILVIDWFRDKRVDLCMDCSVDLKTWWEAGQIESFEKAVKEEEYMYPKAELPNTEEFAKYIRERLLRGLVEGLEPYAVFEENETMLIPELADKNGWAKEYICTLDVCLPAKLVPGGDLKGDSIFYCSRCLEKAKETNTEPPIHFWWSAHPYCGDCGSRLTNVQKDEDSRSGYIIIKEEE